MTRRTRSVALAGAVVFAIVGLFQVQSVKGQELRNQGLVSAPIVAPHFHVSALLDGFSYSKQHDRLLVSTVFLMDHNLRSR